MPGLDDRRAPGLVDALHRVDVLAHVEHHGSVGALAAEAGTAATGQDRHAEPVTHRDRGDDVVDVARHDNADRHLPVVRRVG